MEDDRDRTDATTYLIVYLFPGLMLAPIVALAAKRIGVSSLGAIFVAGWVASLLFSALIRTVTKDAS